MNTVTALLRVGDHVRLADGSACWAFATDDLRASSYRVRAIGVLCECTDAGAQAERVDVWLDGQINAVPLDELLPVSACQHLPKGRL